MSKERLHYIDVCKGILILLVILHHLPMIGVGVVGIQSDILDQIDQCSLIYAPFFMPAFFLITGYCSNTKKKFFSYLLSNAKTIILPAFFLGYMNRVIQSLAIGVTDYSIYIKPGFRVLILNGGPYWFLTALFVAKIIYWIISKYINNLICRYVILLLLSVLGCYCVNENFYEIWQMYHALILLLFLEVGNSLKSITIGKKLGVMSITIYALMDLCSVFINEQPVITRQIHISMVEIPLFVVLSVLGSVGIIYISKQIKTNKILESLGKGSIVVYGLHLSMLTICLSPVKIFAMDLPLIEWILYIITYLFVVFICLCLVNLFYNTRLKFLIGKF